MIFIIMLGALTIAMGLFLYKSVAIIPGIATIVVGALIILIGIFGKPVNKTEQSLAVQVVQAAPEESYIAPLFTPEVQLWGNIIKTWADQYGFDPNLVATVMQIESCGDPYALSSAGAMGLFQVMPFHFVAGEDSYDPNTNALRGLNYLRKSMDAGGSIEMTLAGYNAGIGGSQQPKEYWPAETQRYIYWGVQIYNDATAGKAYSDRLDEWLNRGGASLCAQAAANLP